MWRIKQFFRRIRNLYRWLPIIWKDQDWDDWYIFEILKFKIRNQADYIGKKGNHLSAKRDAEIMYTCYRLMDDIQNEFYGDEYFKYYKQDLNFVDSESHPGMYEMELGEIKMDNLDIYFAKYPRIYKQIIESKIKTPFKTDTKLSIAMAMSHINQQRAHKLLFKILEQNITRWWD